MIVSELIEILKGRPPSAPVYLWDGDGDQFLPVGEVSFAAGKHATTPATATLPPGAIVIWSE